MKITQRSLAFLLCLIMILTLLPNAEVWAEANNITKSASGLDIGYGQKLPWVIRKENTDTEQYYFVNTWNAVKPWERLDKWE